MTTFNVGDRVRVLTLPTTRGFAGRTGEVVGTQRTPAGRVYSYLVQLDSRLPRASGEIRMPFRLGELEPEVTAPP